MSQVWWSSSEGDPQCLGIRESLEEGGLGAGFNMALAFLVESRNKAQSRLSGRKVFWLEVGAKQAACVMSNRKLDPKNSPKLRLTPCKNALAISCLSACTSFLLVPHRPHPLHRGEDGCRQLRASTVSGKLKVAFSTLV